MVQELYKIPLKQHIGKPSIAVVKVGEHVQRGSLLGCAQEGVSSNIHASICGKVISITNDYIEIKADKNQTKEFLKIEGNTIIELIKNAGIVGMGGAGFPTHIKLGRKLDNNGVVIVNAAECEPILAHNIKAIEEKTEKLIKGIKYVCEAVNADSAVIAIKEKHKKAVETLEYLVKRENIDIHLLPDLYPMGEERAVIREVVGTLLKVDELPMKVNAVVINVETVCRIQEAVDLRKPVIDKDLTVAGQINSEKNIHVFEDIPIGTKVETVLKAVGGILDDHGEIILGGPFTGSSAKLDSGITKTTGGIIVTMPSLKEKRPIGLLVCACGANEERLREIADNMNGYVVAVEKCKQAIEINGALKCENPGKCPGQSQKVLALRKSGAEVLLISNCTDCSNTVMSIAPKLKMPVYHCTDGALRAVGMQLVRKVNL